LAAVALIAGVGPEAAFWLPCGLFLLAALAVAAMRVCDAGQCGRAEAQAAGIRDSGLRELARGFTALWQDPALRVLAIAVLIIAAVYMPTEAVILPAYFNDLQDPAGLGIVIAAISGGSMIGAFGFLLGLVWGPFNPHFSTLVQRRIRPEEQGRVYGVQLAGCYAAPPIGMVAAGISVDALGVAVTYLALGLLLAACAIPIDFLRSIRDLDSAQ